mmetsp:Transcript_9419/g.42730  ORF Transcript_9419/g.42730 Transcript_9419/m.42730 type:complete len:243 (+) Transcript_9419:868-1596(+)
MVPRRERVHAVRRGRDAHDGHGLYVRRRALLVRPTRQAHSSRERRRGHPSERLLQHAVGVSGRENRQPAHAMAAQDWRFLPVPLDPSPVLDRLFHVQADAEGFRSPRRRVSSSRPVAGGCRQPPRVERGRHGNHGAPVGRVSSPRGGHGSRPAPRRHLRDGEAARHQRLRPSRTARRRRRRGPLRSNARRRALDATRGFQRRFPTAGARPGRGRDSVSPAQRQRVSGDGIHDARRRSRFARV